MSSRDNGGGSERFGRSFEARGRHETIFRQKEQVIEAFGEMFMSAFTDPNTIEIMRNENGKVFHERLGEKMRYIGDMDSISAMNGIRALAGAVGLTITTTNPVMDTEFLLDGSRFAALIPPTVSSPVFTLRKKAVKVFTLDDYIADGIMTSEFCERIIQAVTGHRNILVIGGTGSGKTTLSNTIIGEVTRQFPDERIIIIEDTREIQCTAKNYVQLHTAPMADPPVTMTRLLKSALRMRPDRILVGEARGEEALDLLDAWNTGHEGGIATIHSNTALSGLTRLKSLVTRNEHSPDDIEDLIGQVVHMVIHIAKAGQGKVVKEILELEGWDSVNRRYVFRGEPVLSE
jgi:type IV secretion system protein VirB11